VPGMGVYIVKMKGGGQGDVRGTVTPSCARAVVVLGGCALMFGERQEMAEDDRGNEGLSGSLIFREGRRLDERWKCARLSLALEGEVEGRGVTSWEPNRERERARVGGAKRHGSTGSNTHTAAIDTRGKDAADAGKQRQVATREGENNPAAIRTGGTSFTPPGGGGPPPLLTTPLPAVHFHNITHSWTEHAQQSLAQDPPASTISDTALQPASMPRATWFIQQIIPPALLSYFFWAWKTCVTEIGPGYIGVQLGYPVLGWGYTILATVLISSATVLFLRLYFLPSSQSVPPSQLPPAISRREVIFECLSPEEAAAILDAEGSSSDSTERGPIDPPAPETETENGEREPVLNRCWKGRCNGRWKPARARHCSECGTCRAGFDHHCAFVSGVGFSMPCNQLQFAVDSPPNRSTSVVLSNRGQLAPLSPLAPLARLATGRADPAPVPVRKLPHNTAHPDLHPPPHSHTPISLPPLPTSIPPHGITRSRGVPTLPDRRGSEEMVRLVAVLDDSGRAGGAVCRRDGVGLESA
jgi:hypothetical protein